MIGRFAPSPTGAQHLGNARTFLLTWLSARSQNGRLLLRIEDLDTPRVKSWASDQILEDLAWLGLTWDAGDHGDGTVRDHLLQTDRAKRHREVLGQLISRELVYPCTCTRGDIAAASSAPHEILSNSQSKDHQADSFHRRWRETLDSAGHTYPGTCAHRSALEANDLQDSGRNFSWRFRMPPGSFEWIDQLAGPMEIDNLGQLGDFVVAKQSGAPAYQLAVIVDDYDAGVTEVVRGEDLLLSTFRQEVLRRSLGWPSPIYYHVPLVVGCDGRRLAKRHGDHRISWYRQGGLQSEEIIGWLAAVSGLISRYQPMRPTELLEGFSWHQLSRQTVVLDKTPWADRTSPS
ncbi:MAG: tRNA glutamyl-Q(34) synthetase GluQRS [Pirellulaceae bacterium]|jgi:glutamyl-tRNA synthetase